MPKAVFIKQGSENFLFLQVFSTLVVPTLAKEMDPFSWIMWHAVAVKRHSYLAHTAHQLQVILTQKMLE